MLEAFEWRRCLLLFFFLNQLFGIVIPVIGMSRFGVQVMGREGGYKEG